MIRTRILRTYLADCASFALALTDQPDLQRAPAFAVQVLCAGEMGHTQPVRKFLQEQFELLPVPITTDADQRKATAIQLCMSCLCLDAELPEQVRLAHQRITTLINNL